VFLTNYFSKKNASTTSVFEAFFAKNHLPTIHFQLYFLGSIFMKNSLFLLKKWHFGLFFLFFGKISEVAAQDFMMQAWYWDYPKNGCYGFTGSNWAANLNTKVAGLKTAGFTRLWLPPASRASFGSCSNGYDPKDLYDLGEYGLGRTGFGTRAEINTLNTNLNSSPNVILPVADVIFNHRDGGAAENNPAVANWITNFPIVSGAAPFPSDRFRNILPIGGSTGRGAGTYKFKISSKTGSANFNGKTYIIYTNTNIVGYQNQPNLIESEPNGGNDCSQSNNIITLGRNLVATVETGGSCNTDEFQLTITAGQFNAANDAIFIYLANQNGDYSDHRIYGIQYTPATGGSETDQVNGISYQTYTDFQNLPSNRGGMNYLNFKPNGIDPTTLSGFEDGLWFFYDYEQAQLTTKDSLNVFAKWLLQNVGFGGLRMDAVKHFPPAFVGQMMNYLHSNGINPPMIVGENFDGSPGVLVGWINAVEAAMTPAAKTAIKVRAFDFALRESLKNASDLFAYDVRNVFNSGIVNGGGANSYNAVTFVNNHDFRDAGQPVQNDPMLGYAYILTNNSVGLPCVFYPEYYGTTVPNYPAANLKTKIDQLILLHKTWITGASSVDYLSRNMTPYYQYFVPGNGQKETTLTYQLSGGTGGKEVIVAINYSGTPLDYYQGVNFVNGVGVGSTFTNMIYGGTTNITNNQEIHITIPARSYTVYVQGVQQALPVEWMDISGSFLEKNRAEIRWSVGSENQNKQFVVEKSTDGGHAFAQIGAVAGRGDAQLQKVYFFIDENFETDAHYRIQQIDFDEKSTQSRIIFIKNLNNTVVFGLFPNPSKIDNRIKLAIESGILNSENLQIELSDAAGKLISRFDGAFVDTENWLNSVLQNHETGILFLKINQSNGVSQTLPIARF
jgi:hypothetical protein